MSPRGRPSARLPASWPIGSARSASARNGPRQPSATMAWSSPGRYARSLAAVRTRTRADSTEDVLATGASHEARRVADDYSGSEDTQAAGSISDIVRLVPMATVTSSSATSRVTTSASLDNPAEARRSVKIVPVSCPYKTSTRGAPRSSPVMEAIRRFSEHFGGYASPGPLIHELRAAEVLMNLVVSFFFFAESPVTLQVDVTRSLGFATCQIGWVGLRLAGEVSRVPVLSPHDRDAR